MDFLDNLVLSVNDVLYAYVLIILLVGLGIWFTFRTGFVQLRCIKEMVRLLCSNVGASTEKNHISPFQAFCISTASRVGVGNIAGIAIAIIVGGPGAIFWMWVMALIGSATGFVESWRRFIKFRVQKAVSAAARLIILKMHCTIILWLFCL